MIIGLKKGKFVLPNRQHILITNIIVAPTESYLRGTITWEEGIKRSFRVDNTRDKKVFIGISPFNAFFIILLKNRG